MTPRVNRCATWMLVAVLGFGVAGFGVHWAGPLDAVVVRADAPDKEDEVDTNWFHVYVLVGVTLRNPTGLCTVEPCDPGETLPTEPLYTLTGSPLNLTWGEFQTASARSMVSCKPDGNTSLRVRLSNLRPNAVYSLFYRTFTPDSANPYCMNGLRSVVVPERCTGAGCVPVEDSRIDTDADGEATYVGEVPGCLLDATTLLLDVIYHSNGTTYGPLPSQLAFQTQQPAGCRDCPSCDSSFGRDAHLQVVIIQKAP